jgi:hypothetical protein
MRLVTRMVLPNGEVHWVNGTEALASRGYRLLAGRPADGAWHESGPVPVGILARVLIETGPLSRLLRLGIHNAWRLPSGTILVVLTGRVLRSTDGGKTFVVTHRFRTGRKPAAAGVAVLATGQVYYGEYVAQAERVHPICIHHSHDEGRTFDQVHRFEPGQVRHVHFIQQDPYEPGLWVGTGDLGDECRILRSIDGCRTFEIVGQGSQQWRAVSVIFRPDAVYWGTDAGCDVGNERNWIYRWDRKTGLMERVQEVQGPVHGSAQLADGTMIVSTGVEGGINERDDRAHLWASRSGRKWQELASWRKDRWPFRVQYGVIHFPQGQHTSDILCLNLRGLTGHGLAGLAGTIED